MGDPGEGSGLIAALKLALAIVGLWRAVVPNVASDSETAVTLQPEPVATPAPCVGVRCWLIDAGWPEEWQADAEAIVLCESTNNPDAIGGGRYLGLFQLHPGWFTASELERWNDPVVNATVALRLRQRLGRFGGPGGWECAHLVGVW